MTDAIIPPNIPSKSATSKDDAWRQYDPSELVFRIGNLIEDSIRKDQPGEQGEVARDMYQASAHLDELNAMLSEAIGRPLSSNAMKAPEMRPLDVANALDGALTIKRDEDGKITEVGVSENGSAAIHEAFLALNELYQDRLRSLSPEAATSLKSIHTSQRYR